MLKPDQIPAEAVEAARKFMRLQALSDEWIDDLLAAAINAWPGMHIHEWQRPWLGGMSGTDIILPLTENTND